MGYNSFFALIGMLTNGNYSIGGYIRSLIPVNYFLWLYVAVYLLSPWINNIFEHTSEKNALFMLKLMFVIFSLYPSIYDLYSGMTGTVINGISTVSSTDGGAGYTFVNFIFMYSIGAYIGRYDIGIERRKCTYGYIICSAIIYACTHITMNTLFYSNPFVILAAVFLVLVFQKSDMKSSKIKIILSGLTFQVFIVHVLLYDIWKICRIERLLTGNLLLAIVGFIFAVAMIYICSIGVAICGKVIVYPISSFMEKNIKFSYEIQGEKESNDTRDY